MVWIDNTSEKSLSEIIDEARTRLEQEDGEVAYLEYEEFQNLADEYGELVYAAKAEDDLSDSDVVVKVYELQAGVHMTSYKHSGSGFQGSLKFEDVIYSEDYVRDRFRTDPNVGSVQEMTNEVGYNI